MSRMPRLQTRVSLLWVAAVMVALWGCGGAQNTGGMQGSVKIDGSSTVFPISEAMAEEFQKIHPGVRVTVGLSGTGGGFKKFCAGETDISDASRPIKPTEVDMCGTVGIDYIELPVAFDGIVVVVNRANDFVNVMTVEELKRLWQPESAVRTWSDLRAEWPDREIHLYGPGTDSGTYDYFTKAIVGKEHASRPDFTASEDDNILVRGISGDPDALGYFGFAYYEENRERLKIVPVDPGTGAVTPSSSTINDGSYKPLSRPIFIYVSTQSAGRPEVDAFVDFYLENATALVPEVGYVPLPQSTYDVVKSRFEARTTGSVFGGTKVGLSVDDLLRTSS